MTARVPGRTAPVSRASVNRSSHSVLGRSFGVVADVPRQSSLLSGARVRAPGVSGEEPAPERSRVRLRWLRESDETEFVAAHRSASSDRFVFGLGYIEGTAWRTYLDALSDEQRGVRLLAGRVPATFLVAELDGRIVGRVSVRHRLNEFLEREGGHIGYGVVPEYRNRGLATAMLVQALVIARSHGVDRSLLVCDDDNAASARVIERCGGVLENVIVDDDGARLRRYWIE